MPKQIWSKEELQKFFGVKGERIKPMSSQKLVARTHFRKNPTKDQGWQWFWTTKTPDEQDATAVGGEGYNRIAGALNGFFSSQGVPGWTPGTEQQPMPKGYVLQKISDEHYVVSHYEDVEDNGQFDDNGEDK